MAPRQKGPAAIAQATTEYAAGKYESAIKTLNDAAIDEEESLDLAYLLGIIYARLKKFDEALLYLEQVVTHGDDDSRMSQCRLTLAYIYSATGRIKLAEYELMRLIDSPYQMVMVRTALGHANWKQGRLEDGLRWYDQALALDPENLAALNGFGYLLACSGQDLERALECCAKAHESDLDNPAYTDSLGWVHFKLGNFEEAAKYIYEAAESLPENEESREHVAAYEKVAYG